MKNITIPDLNLLKKHNISIEEFKGFMETDEIQYTINSNASQFYGASLCERNMLARQDLSSRPNKFEAKYGMTWQKYRANLLDKINNNF